MLDKYLENKEYELALGEIGLELISLKEKLLVALQTKDKEKKEKTLITVIAGLNEINFSIRIKGNIGNIIEEKYKEK